MVGQRERERAKNGIAAIETNWTGFISLFKDQRRKYFLPVLLSPLFKFCFFKHR